MRIQYVTFAAATTLCVACSLPAFADPKAELIAADKAFSGMSVAQGSDAAFVAYMADDGRMFGTGDEPPMIGKAAAQARFAARKQTGPRMTTLSWAPDNAEASTDGTVGYTDGHWLYEGKDAKGAAIHLTGHYVTVWRKAPSGGWKVVADMGTTDPAPGAH